MIMPKITFAMLLAAGVAGCATHDSTTSTPYGNFVQDSPAACDRTMAADAVKRLIAVYPPARTRFDLRQITPDAFGTALVASLRARGYALLEYQPEQKVQDPLEPAGQAPAPAVAATIKPSIPALTLRYVLDLDAASNLYRVTLLVGTQSLTRAYLAQNGSVAPAGAWVRKE